MIGAFRVSARDIQAGAEITTDLSKPNTNAVERYRQQPLIEKDPVRFWQLISLLLALTIVLMLLF